MNPPSLRVLMTTDAVGGVWVYATALARGLCKAGCRVTLVTLGPAPRADQLRELRAAAIEPIVTDLALEWMDPEGRDFARGLDRLGAIEGTVSPDIVHLNGYREAAGEWSAPVVLAAHSCVGSWWRACRGEHPCEPRWAAYLDNVRAGLALADRWIAPTEAFRQTIEELYTPPTPGRVIWNGLDDRMRLGVKEPFILAAGRLWDEAKNVASLTGVAARVPWPIRIAGSLQSSMAGADQTNRTAGLQALGELSRAALMREMERASIFVAPAIYEPFGLSVLEAARAGCALVLSNIASFRELWSGAALFIDPRDSDAGASILTQLGENESLRRDLQSRARRRARRYSLDAMTASYLDLYRDTIGQRRSATATRSLTREGVRP